ncbi:putative 2-alkenal reductase (NAD(P)(+)) [Medicago truncatula]|uniref:Putative 2-alkenal reductase (NAD(P)(+)) n=1 Tax=Medicago truncatula TaxID=3880 RepID=A0A072V9D4_MEDTR|nr:reticulon-4-interacting protein 1, mitochondrial [Medicago truncatula]KEH38664.1 zinc-binding dehydrogenase family oxidoreductase [Medicago truncatula]RHN75030.1 putative 2-alkenal reductase (NAD(P)(+)) [Medicago truncatula]
MRIPINNRLRTLITHSPSKFRHVSTCRAVLLPSFGGPQNLEIHPNVEVPPLKPNEVLVHSRAVSINPLDTRMRVGYGRSVFERLLPIILGRDVSGEVAAVGASVKSVTVGQQVFGALHPTAVRGTYTDYAILSEEEVTSKPDSLSHVEASAIPFAALTAWRALNGTARITEGQRILVVGGGGAVGFSAIQLAVAAGCSVTTTCGSQSVERMLAAGAEQAVDYLSENYELTIKGKFDAVLDTIGVPDTERMGISFLRRGGHYMTLQGEAASLADRLGLTLGLPAATAFLLRKQIQYRLSNGIEYSWVFMRSDIEGLIEIRKLCEAGKMKIPVDKTFPITQVKEAHEAKDKRIIQGKVVLEFD